MFGCELASHSRKQTGTSCSPKQYNVSFLLGYSLQSKAYPLYDPQARKVIISRDVTFLEDQRYAGTGVSTVAEGNGTVEVMVEGEPPYTQPSASASTGPSPASIVVDDDLSPAPMGEDDAEGSEEQEAKSPEQPQSIVRVVPPNNAADQEASGPKTNISSSSPSDSVLGLGLQTTSLFSTDCFNWQSWAIVCLCNQS